MTGNTRTSTRTRSSRAASSDGPILPIKEDELEPPPPLADSSDDETVDYGDDKADEKERTDDRDSADRWFTYFIGSSDEWKGPVEWLDSGPGIREIPTDTISRPVGRHDAFQSEEHSWRGRSDRRCELENMEIAIAWPLTRWCYFDRELDVDEVLVFQVDRHGQVQKLIERDTNVLTLSEAREHSEACRQAMKDELERWLSLQAFERQRRSDATNVLDSRWVLKWKWVENAAGVKERIIKARMTVRGYKDIQAPDLETFSATTSRWGQRVVVWIAAQQGWDIFSADVAQAFLRGAPFETIEKTAGGETRAVSFTVPPGSESILRECDGFADFCGRTEVLKMLRAGFGLKDAPRAWAVVLIAVLGAFGLVPVRSDRQLFVKHVGGHLVLVLSTHVDDLKGAGVEHERVALRAHLEKEFGKLKFEQGGFTHVGIRHRQAGDKSISLDQDEYANSLGCIDTDLYEFMELDSDAPAELQKYYMTLLGGVAWLCLTRPATCVYVSYLQRHAKKPTMRHIRDLNRLVRWNRKTPQSMVYRHLPGQLKLVVVPDSSFSAGDTEGLVMRGCFIMIVAQDQECSPTGMVAVLDFYARKQSHVCRSTFAAELHSALDAYNQAFIIQCALTELTLGAQTATQLLERTAQGALMPPMELCVDAKSVFDAITASTVQVPADKHLFIHVLRMRELVDSGEISRLWWIDTVMMIADGMTKGSIPRDDILMLVRDCVWKRNGDPPISYRRKPAQVAFS